MLHTTQALVFTYYRHKLNMGLYVIYVTIWSTDATFELLQKLNKSKQERKEGNKFSKLYDPGMQGNTCY